MSIIPITQFFQSKHSPKTDDFFISNMDELSESLKKLCSKDVLLVGEGDFSYTLIYAKKHPLYTIVATAYDTKAQAIAKYGEKFIENQKAIQTQCKNVTLKFSVDATKLTSKLFTIKKFQKIIFNFPETGQRDGSTAVLVYNFFHSARHVLAKNGVIQCVGCSTPHYDGIYKFYLAAPHNRFKLTKRKTCVVKHHHVETNKNKTPKPHPILKHTFKKIESDDEKFDSDYEFSDSEGLSYDDAPLSYLKTIKRSLGKGKEKITGQERLLRKIKKNYGSTTNAYALAEEWLKEEEEATEKANTLLRLLRKIVPKSISEKEVAFYNRFLGEEE